MNKHIFNILFLSFFSVLSIFGEEFDLAMNWGNVGWSMNISKDYNEHILNVDLFDIYIEHEKSNIGIKFNPIQLNNEVFSFLNIGVSYNILNIWRWSEFTKEGSNYFFLGPYFAINYLIANDLGDFNFMVGIRTLGIIDNPESPFGWQILNFEFGYRFNNNKINTHNFYFNLSLDIIIVAYILGKFYEK